MSKRPTGLAPYELFFPLAAIETVVAMVVSVVVFEGKLAPRSDLAPQLWHAHEMLFGHFPAAFAGVVLTALPRWTRDRATGAPGRPVPAAATLILAALWLFGRVVMLTDPIPGSVALPAAASALFPLVLAGVAGARIVEARDLRDYGVVLLLVAFAAADGLFLIEGYRDATTGVGLRLGLAGAAAGAMTLGGRILPALTRHLATSRGRPEIPPPPALFDAAALAFGIAAAILWVIAPLAPVTLLALGLAAALHVVRLAFWRGWTVIDWPPFLALHAGYLFLPIGFALRAASIAGGDDVTLADAATHAWGVGTLGLMCVSIMTSVVRRYSDRGLVADRLANTVFAASALAIALRFAAIAGGSPTQLVVAATVAWVATYGAFLGLVARDLVARRAARFAWVPGAADRP
ncbi:NnrS family protein [Siculibacillus lacustris]|uniref:NnrS family protein n=1 Tax=Siculibacillus lacustris TaxID=1549641 RepID=A0A4Q9VYE5_9HYPH|nr:NnrS family protein [Siculibacillus lacustris]TBW41052.1 NnrS family protein [Siculibacillus lacustris]